MTTNLFEHARVSKVGEKAEFGVDVLHASFVLTSLQNSMLCFPASNFPHYPPHRRFVLKLARLLLVISTANYV